MTTYKPESDAEQDFLDSYDPSKFPVTVNTVDMIVHTETHVLLIKRGNWPYKNFWALPGGFIDQKETTAQAALRELREEAGLMLKEENLMFVGVADEPDRDPRARAISFVYSAQIPDEWDLYSGDDAVDAQWFAFHEVMARGGEPLAFDHASILALFLLHGPAQEAYGG